MAQAKGAEASVKGQSTVVHTSIRAFGIMGLDRDETGLGRAANIDACGRESRAGREAPRRCDLAPAVTVAEVSPMVEDHAEVVAAVPGAVAGMGVVMTGVGVASMSADTWSHHLLGSAEGRPRVVHVAGVTGATRQLWAGK